MLEPNDRTLLHELLRPPADHRLDVAVGTTYSLDLISLLSAPVSFALFDIDSASISSEAGSLEVLESVRRYADRTTVFTMAGQISVPSAYRSVLTYLEDSIVEVKRPQANRVFHPKLWVLRYRSEESDSIIHRLVILSRNLTYDASWDISAILDESPDTSGEDCAAPIARFLRALRDGAGDRLKGTRREQLTDIADSVALARFEVPSPFHSMRLHPMGPGFPRVDLPRECDKALVISPFLSADRIASWQSVSRSLTLISRPEEIDRLPHELVPDDSYVMSPHVQPLDEDGGELSGLHAKLYVADSGKESQWWLGSANATHAAFEGNAEFLLQLTGSVGTVGVKRLLASPAGEVSLISILEPYRRSALVPEEGSPNQASPEEDALIALAESGLVLEVGPEHEAGSRITYPLTITCDVTPPEGIRVWMRPLALRGDDEAKLLGDRPLTWPGVSLTSVSPYVVVKVEGEHSIERLVLAELRGDPPSRRDAILAQLIASQEGFLRYLLLLLSDSSLDTALSMSVSSLLVDHANDRHAARYDLPLLESLLRSLSRNPGDLLRVKELLADLQRTPEGQQLVPEQFDQIWAPLSDALSILQSGRSQ